MARVKFKIGNSPGIHFNLPSREFGNSEVFIGKVTVDSGKLKCSGEFSIQREMLVNLCQLAKSITGVSKGSCKLMSLCNRLGIEIDITEKGHAKINAKMSGFEFASPDNQEWYSESTFYLYTDKFKELLENESQIRS